MKILIANRGEIAVRVIRACREMGIPTVAVFSDCDRGARHVSEADQAIHVGPSEATRSYLDIGALLEAARRSEATAVHPGYGFLAENAAFASACLEAGLMYIGPAPEAIALMGSKTAARQAARRAGVPVVPGTDEPFGPDVSEREIAAAAEEVGYPLLVKAVAGGGGKGLRVVSHRGDLPSAIQLARSEAGAAFGDSQIYLERRILQPRHVEIQLLGDARGTVVPFVERECSIQRRHQKVVEESPSPVVTPALRRRMAEAAASVARLVGYTNAGTIEFLLDRDGAFYFLEMNTRLQVEHPVTEMVTSIDLVQWQIRISRGEALDVDPERALTPHGHAIECRIYAEDPDQGFLPSPGLIRALRPAGGPGIRDDSGVAAGYTVPVHYDSLIAKLVAWASARDEAVARMARALREYHVLGIRTTIPFFLWLLRQPAFLEARFDTNYLDALLAERQGATFSELEPGEEDLVAIGAALDAWLRAGGAGDNGRRAVERVSAWHRLARRESLRE
ncbi:MAG TPA: acetyl-CoA carboxylase biotin carboxylase subunit [Vicinamibacterales bacterium]|nr:acetyl-CoA carboxylase biotin carboxylase subunit [Vicinamibacterales bacterium]